MGNLITSIVKAYRPIKGYNKFVNRSRVINSYIAIIDIIYIGVNYGIFRLTNQLILIYIMFVSAIIKIVGAFIVQIKQSMRFIYSIILIILTLLMILILLILLIIRLINIFSICKLLDNYHNKYPDLDNSATNKCSKQITYYFFWMGEQLLFFSTGIIEIHFDLIAHNVLKKKEKRKKN